MSPRLPSRKRRSQDRRDQDSSAAPAAGFAPPAPPASQSDSDPVATAAVPRGRHRARRKRSRPVPVKTLMVRRRLGADRLDRARSTCRRCRSPRKSEWKRRRLPGRSAGTRGAGSGPDRRPGARSRRTAAAPVPPARPTQVHTGWIHPGRRLSGETEAKQRLTTVKGKAGKLLGSTDAFTEPCKRAGPCSTAPALRPRQATAPRRLASFSSATMSIA